MILNKLTDERGSLLLISYMVIVVFLGLGAAFLLLSVGETKTAERQRLSTAAFHIAEAGIERALYDLRQDFVNATGTPSWTDDDINGHTITLTSSYQNFPYASSELLMNGGAFAIQMKSVGEDVWVKSVGTIEDADHTLEVYVRMINLSPWNNAIFAGAGASGTMVNGNVDIRGSVHILGTGLNPGDYAINLGGTAEIVGNNYAGLDSSLDLKVPALPTTVVGGETVDTLGAELRVKKGLVGLSGSSTVGQANVAGNSTKETVDGVYVTDGWGGTSGSSSVYSDNGTSNPYDLGESVAFPSLSDPYGGYSNYKAYLGSLGAYVVSSSTDLTELANVDPNSSFTIGDATNYVTMDGSGNMTVSGIVIIDENSGASLNGDFNMSTAGSAKTINYTGTGTLYVEGNVQVDVNLVTAGNNSFPNNIMGVMTENNIGFNEANIDAMGLFYAENQVTVAKQTDIMGTIVSNYFDMGTNVPSLYQVPEVMNNLPPGMIGENATWYMVVAWLKS